MDASPHHQGIHLDSVKDNKAAVFAASVPMKPFVMLFSDLVLIKPPFWCHLFSFLLLLQPHFHCELIKVASDINAWRHTPEPDWWQLFKCMFLFRKKQNQHMMWTEEVWTHSIYTLIHCLHRQLNVNVLKSLLRWLVGDQGQREGQKDDYYVSPWEACHAPVGLSLYFKLKWLKLRLK